MKKHDVDIWDVILVIKEEIERLEAIAKAETDPGRKEGILLATESLRRKLRTLPREE